jgi:hypothetical protein
MSLPLLLTIQITIVLFTGCFVDKAKDSSFYETSIVSSTKSAIHVQVRVGRDNIAAPRKEDIYELDVLSLTFQAAYLRSVAYWRFITLQLRHQVLLFGW